MCDSLQDEFTARIQVHFKTQPASCCFLVAVLLIAVTLASLGLYVKKNKVLPDLDSMKNWNAYLGKLNTNDYCFHINEFYNSSVKSVFERVHFLESDSDYNSKNNVTYGTVGTLIQFSVSDIFFQSHNSSILYSSFTGKDIGTQIKDAEGKRIDSDIHLQIWINLTSYNGEDCSDSRCTIEGCFVISAPFTAVPTRMPHIHRDFAFASKLYNSKSKPSNCSFGDVIELQSIVELGLMDTSRCSGDHSTLLLIPKAINGFKTKGTIVVNLQKADKEKASLHMFLSSLCLLVTECAMVVVILLRNKNIVKNSQE